MANEVTYGDEQTHIKAMKALYGDGAMTFGEVLAAVERLQAAGIIFREPAESKPRGPRTKAEQEADSKQEVEAVPETFNQP